ncbi:MAG: sulfotransferase [Crocinitomicaceae bacterium]|nr:sulfotransferase [Crocinitomicaceae bacterium]
MSQKTIKEHQLYISSLSVLWRLWRVNRKSIVSKRMCFKILFFTIISAPFRWLQYLYFNRKIQKIDFKKKPPVFVIGHWRSGTTHLHYLLSQDPQFSHLEAFQAFFFRVALISKKTMRPLLNKLMPKTRPQDNVLINAAAPTEEEHCLTNLTHRSAMHSFFFPKNQSYFTEFHLFKTTKSSLNKWKKTYNRMLQEIAFYNGIKRTLLLKNPHNTGRIKVLKELYPEAKFIFIHRNPYEVYQSTVHLYNTTIKSQFLQEYSQNAISETVINSYELVMKKFIKERNAIPKSQLCEVSFTELSKDPIHTLKHIYSELNIADFEKALPFFEQYVNKNKGYKKNKFTPLTDDVKRKLKDKWSFAFSTWNYTR